MHYPKRAFFRHSPLLSSSRRGFFFAFFLKRTGLICKAGHRYQASLAMRRRHGKYPEELKAVRLKMLHLDVSDASLLEYQNVERLATST